MIERRRIRDIFGKRLARNELRRNIWKIIIININSIIIIITIIIIVIDIHCEKRKKLNTLPNSLIHWIIGSK